jgi:hypothetical protein
MKMGTLGELLEDLGIKMDDSDDKSDDNDKDKINLDEVKLEDIPEKHRPVFQTLMETKSNLENELAKKDLTIDTLKDATKSIITQTKTQTKTEDKTDSDEKVLGVLDPQDPYAPAFQTLANMIDGIKTESTVDKEKQWENNLRNFAKENKDIAKYAKTMDALVDEHPTLRSDIPKLYRLAKSIHEGRDKKAGDKIEDIKKTEDANRFRTESSGISNANVQEIAEVKSISDAFNLAEKKMSKSG